MLNVPAPNIYKIYKEYTKHQAAARQRQPGPAPSRGPRSGPGGSGPGRAAAAWPPLGITVLVYILYFLYIFGYTVNFLIAACFFFAVVF